MERKSKFANPIFNNLIVSQLLGKPRSFGMGPVQCMFLASDLPKLNRSDLRQHTQYNPVCRLPSVFTQRTYLKVDNQCAETRGAGFLIEARI